MFAKRSMRTDPSPAPQENFPARCILPVLVFGPALLKMWDDSQDELKHVSWGINKLAKHAVGFQMQERSPSAEEQPCAADMTYLCG